MEQDEDDLKEWVSAATAGSRSRLSAYRVFTVSRDGPQRFSVDAGRARGVTEGAWLLVGDRAHSQQRSE